MVPAAQQLLATVPGACSRAAEVPGERPGQVRGPHEARGVAQRGLHDDRLGAIAAPGQLVLKGIAGRCEQQLTGLGEAATDDERAWVDGGGEVGDADAEPLPDLAEQLDGRVIALLGQLGDQRAR